MVFALFHLRMKRVHSTQHALDNKDYTDLTLNKACIKRRAAVVLIMLQAHVQLALCWIRRYHSPKRIGHYYYGCCISHVHYSISWYN